MAIRVLLPQPILPAGYEYLREHGYEVVDGRGFTEDDIVADITDCDAIIVRTAKITKRIFDAAPKLKILARHGAGYDGVDPGRRPGARGAGVHRRRGQRHLGGRADHLLHALLLPELQEGPEAVPGGLPPGQDGRPQDRAGGQDPGPGGLGQHRQAGGQEGRSGL